LPKNKKNMQLFWGIFLMFVAQVLTFYQVQGGLKYPWFKNNYPLVLLMGIPISVVYIESIHQMIAHYGGLLWPSRIIGFGVGVIVFAVLSALVFEETITLKTFVLLGLSLLLILIQLFWK
jgi:hypothetical protein